MGKVSILVNCYNSESFLKEALDSIYNQTYGNFEILLVDNCSTDRTADIAKSYPSKLLYIKTDKLMSLYAARNVGLSHASGDYLAFLDSDDIWLPTKLERQITTLKNTSATFLYGNYGNLIEHNSKLKKKFIKLYLGLLKFNLNFRHSGFVATDNLFKNYDINLQTVLIDRKLLRENRFNENLNLYGDFEYFLRLLLLKKTDAYFVAKKISLSRIHQKQLSRKNTQNWIKEFKITYKSLAPLMSEKQKRDFLNSHYCLHRSNLLIERSKFLHAWKIKTSLAWRSFPLFLHFLKSNLDMLLKKIF